MSINDEENIIWRTSWKGEEDKTNATLADCCECFGALLSCSNRGAFVVQNVPRRGGRNTLIVLFLFCYKSTKKGYRMNVYKKGIV